MSGEMAVKGLRPVLGTEKCQLLLFRTEMDGREAAVSGGAFSLGPQGLSPQSVSRTSSVGTAGSL